MADDLIIATEGPIARVTINRPQAYNAMKAVMWRDILRYVQEIEHDPKIRVLIIEGSGRNFCSGADVGEFAASLDKSPREMAVHWMRQADSINPLFVTLERIPQPVIASVRGVAAGGGLGLVAAADLVVASETSRYFAAQIKLGAIPDSAVSFNLRRAIGIRKAKQYCFLGDEMDAQTALDLGLVNWVVADDQLEAETLKLARRLSRMPVVAIARTKAALNASFRNTLVDHFLEEAADVGRCVSHPDFAENVRRFMDRKRPA
ncbi:MAG TPA: enoyl-CoA hydratase/isomerase family protein [Tepidisphaeraceae bacterium]|nr:enoyl-CoA hydratase/isomerase family protein [Tepidisphaeraceae bacterium]